MTRRTQLARTSSLIPPSGAFTLIFSIQKHYTVTVTRILFTVNPVDVCEYSAIVPVHYFILGMSIS